MIIMPVQKRYTVFVALCIMYIISCVDEDKKADTTDGIPENKTQLIPYSVVNSMPHDTLAFTEGLCWYNGKLYESTGSPGELPQTKSYWGIINTANGKVENRHELDRSIFFGEGITILHDRLFQLTYKNRKGFVYDLHSMKKIGGFSFFNEEGWGLTTDGQYLIMSDGTSNITYMDPKTYKALKILRVTENGNAVDQLNELEYIDGWLFANVYRTNYIVKINPETGVIAGKMDLWPLAKMAKDEYPRTLEMNGIAYNPGSKTMYVTGKMWPRIFEIKLNW
jgi:glutamine cyclotransferase